MKVIYRAPSTLELPEATDVFISGVTALTQRFGLPAPSMTRAQVQPMYEHIHKTGLFEIAEVGGQIAVVCNAIIREKQWFLSGFWARPDYRGQGIGGPMLQRLMEEGKKRGAETFFTWSSADPAAMTSYLKNGMLPGTQILIFAGTPVVRSTPEATLVPLQPESVEALDRRVRGAARTIDHQRLIESGAAAHAVEVDGHRAGYFYSQKGSIGPAVWDTAADAKVVLGQAMEVARMQASEVRLAVPGSNHDAVRFALKVGLRLFWFAHLLTSAPFGELDHYVPSGPYLF